MPPPLAAVGPSPQPQTRAATETPDGTALDCADPEYQSAAFGAQGLSYRLRALNIKRPNQVSAADLAYVPMGKGCMYLWPLSTGIVAVCLAWRVANRLDRHAWPKALAEAIDRYGVPEIF